MGREFLVHRIIQLQAAAYTPPHRKAVYIVPATSADDLGRNGYRRLTSCWDQRQYKPPHVSQRSTDTCIDVTRRPTSHVELNRRLTTRPVLPFRPISSVCFWWTLRRRYYWFTDRQAYTVWIDRHKFSCQIQKLPDAPYRAYLSNENSNFINQKLKFTILWIMKRSRIGL